MNSCRCDLVGWVTIVKQLSEQTVRYQRTDVCTIPRGAVSGTQANEHVLEIQDLDVA
jgi:hypothetical protein